MILKITLNKYLKWIAKILAWIFVPFLTVLLATSLLLLLPSVQTFVATKATQIISDKTGMEIKIGSVYLGFPKTVKLANIFIEDAKSDTLLFCHHLDIDVQMISLVRKKVNLELLKIEGLRTNIYQNDTDSSYNFSPWISSFSKNKNDEPPSTKSNWSVGFEDIELIDIKANYHSNLDSSAIGVNLGQLSISANNVDLIANKFYLDKIDLKNTSFSMTVAQRTDTVSQDDPEPLPFEIKLSELNVADFLFDLKSVDGNFALSTKAGILNILPRQLDLARYNIELDVLTADAIDVALKITPPDSMKIEANLPQPIISSPYTFGEIPWQILVHQSNISNTNYKMDLGAPTDKKNTAMDYSHLFIQNIHFVADSVFFNKNTTGGNLKHLQAMERSGAEIKKASGIIRMDNQSIIAKNMDIAMNQTWTKGTASLSYISLDKIGEKIADLGIKADLKGNIFLNELAPFTSVVKDYPILHKVENIGVNGFKIHGNLGNLSLGKSNLTLGKATAVEAHGSIKGLPSSDLNIALTLDTLRTSALDLTHILPDTLLPQEAKLPNALSLSASFSYQKDFMDLGAFLKSDFGNLSVNARQLQDSLVANFDLDTFDAGSLLGDSTIGKITMNGQFKGVGSTEKLNSFGSKIHVDSMEFMEKKYGNLDLRLDGKGDEYAFIAEMQDSVLAFSANGKATINDSSKNIAADVNLIHASLNKMHLMEKYLTVSGDFNLRSDFMSPDDMAVDISLSDLLLAKENQNYKINETRLTAEIRETYTNFDFTSDVLSASLSGNTRISELKTAFNNHLNNYIEIPDSLLSEKEFQFDFDLKLNKPDFFTDFLVDGLKEISLENFQANYNGKKDIFEVDIRIPEVKYNNMQVDDASFILTSNQDTVRSDFNLALFSYDSSMVQNISLRSSFFNQKAKFLFTILEQPDSIKYRTEVQLAHEGDTYKLHINPDNLVINKQTWTLDQNNSVQIQDKNILANSASISNGNQKIWATSVGDNLKFNFQNFSIQNITDLLESKQHQLDGEINGYVDLLDVFGEKNIKSALNIHELIYQEKLLGELSLELDAPNGDSLMFATKLKNNENEFSIYGKAYTKTESPEIESELVVGIGQADAFSGLAARYVQGLNGGLRGQMTISGNLEQPLFNGQFDFINLAMAVKPSNSMISTNGSISIKNNLIEFGDFKLKDSLNHQLSVKGSINAQDIYNPDFNLSLTSPEFLIIESPAEKDNPIVGKLLLGMDVQITGKPSAIKINSDFTIHKNTDIMYVMPGKELELITDKNIVTFSEYSQKLDSMDLKNAFVANSFLSDLHSSNLTVNLSIDPLARFRIYVDPNSGDITEFKLRGKLNYTYNNEQRGKLSGLVELTEGYYELSFYGLVKKKFVYDPGSTIAWDGDIMEGNINLSARYEVKTNSVGLVSNEINSYEKSMYNQRLPYQVILHINQEISNPIFSFNIELPDRYTSDQPILESKLNFLNQENNASERNKQVFALLVGGTFIPDNPDVNEGSGNKSFATTAARNSVNAIMTQQLNALTGQFIKGVDLEMGVNTFDDYTTGQAQTQTQLDVKVSKNLFNERVSAEVESHINLDGSTATQGSQSTLGQTEFAVSYQLTKSGNYLIKAFRENAWDIYDGEIQNSGVAFIFVKEFDHFKSIKKPSANPDKSLTPEDQSQQE